MFCDGNIFNVFVRFIAKVNLLKQGLRLLIKKLILPLIQIAKVNLLKQGLRLGFKVLHLWFVVSQQGNNNM